MKIKTILTVGASILMLAGTASAKGKKKTFAELDADKDGKVTEAEYITGAKDEAKAKKRFKKKDKNVDGFLSEEEFNCKKKKGPKKPKKEKQEKDAQ